MADDGTSDGTSVRRAAPQNTLAGIGAALQETSGAVSGLCVQIERLVRERDQDRTMFADMHAMMRADRDRVIEESRRAAEESRRAAEESRRLAAENVTLRAQLQHANVASRKRSRNLMEKMEEIKQALMAMQG